MSMCMEIVKWKSKQGIGESQTIEAVNNMVSDLQECDGFIHQALYKIGDVWCDLYYWKNEQCAHQSNEFMGKKDSLRNLMALIDIETVSIEVSEPKQSSGDLNITFSL